MKFCVLNLECAVETILFDNKARNYVHDIGKIPSVICRNYALNFDNRKCLVCSLAYEIGKKKQLETMVISDIIELSFPL